jgi:nucleoside-diphosphate-sugar epimerase
MRIFVTGASGFIGSRVVRCLLSQGHPVAALVQPGDPMARLQDLAHKLFPITGDLAAFGAEQIAQLSQWRPEACIHLAWYAEPGQYLYSRLNLACLAGGLRLIDGLIASGCRHLVAAGTCAEYALSTEPLVETGPTMPETLYAASKLSLCTVGQQLADRGEIGFGWGRIFYLYGPGEDARRMIPALASSLLNNQPFAASSGDQVRDYLHVDDVANAFITLALCGANGVYNIASAAPVTVREIMQTVGQVLGREELIRFGAVPRRDWEPPFIAGDNQRLRSLGWKPGCSLAEGLRSTVEYWRARIMAHSA